MHFSTIPNEKLVGGRHHIRCRPSTFWWISKWFKIRCGSETKLVWRVWRVWNVWRVSGYFLYFLCSWLLFFCNPVCFLGLAISISRINKTHSFLNSSKSSWKISHPLNLPDFKFQNGRSTFESFLLMKKTVLYLVPRRQKV